MHRQGQKKTCLFFLSNLGNIMDIRAVLNPHIHCLQECEKTTRKLQKIKQVKMLISRTQRILKILIRPSAVLVSRGRNSLKAGVVFSLHCLSLKNTQRQEEYRKERLEISKQQHEEKMNLMAKLIDYLQPRQPKNDK